MDSGPENPKNNHKNSSNSNHVIKKEINHVDDGDLSIGCEEDQTSVNFYVQVQRPHEPKKSASVFPRKKGKIRLKQFGKEKQDDVIRFPVKQNKGKVKIEQVSNKCPVCPFEAAMVNELHEHMRSCIGRKNFNCLDCPYTNQKHIGLLRHIEQHSLKDAAYKCSLCTFGGNKRGIIIKHQEVHFSKCKIGSNVIFQCPLCPFAKTYLKTFAHFRLHAKESEHLKDIIECPLCGIKTKTDTFQKHARYHVLPKAEC